MNKTQYGFCKGLSIEDCRMTIINKLFVNKQNKRDSWALFVDLISAYNLVRRDKIINILKEKKILDVN